MKKKIPLIVLEELEKFVNLQGKNFQVVHEEGLLLKVVDKDESSDFFFAVQDYKTDNTFKLLIEFKPKNKQNVASNAQWVEGKSLNVFFKGWTELLDRYNTIPSFFDDPILNSFTEEYYAEFEIVDEDLELPLKPQQILQLDTYLEFVENNIQKLEDNKNSVQVQEIRNDISNLRENISSKSKGWVVKNLAKIWAKMTKQGTKFMIEFISEAKKKAIQESIKFITQHGADFIEGVIK